LVSKAVDDMCHGLHHIQGPLRRRDPPMPLDNAPGSPRLEARLRRELRARSCSIPSAAGAIRPMPRSTRSSPGRRGTGRAGGYRSGAGDRARGGGAGVGRAAAAPRNAARPSPAPSSSIAANYMDGVVALDVPARRVRVQPGVVLERLNASLRRHKLFYPVDVSTGRPRDDRRDDRQQQLRRRGSLRYGNMVHNVRAIDAILAGRHRPLRFAEVPGNFAEDIAPERYRDLVRDMRALHDREADEIERRFPKVQRRVGGYNIDNDRTMPATTWPICWSAPKAPSPSSPRSELDLQPTPPHRVLGICHFPSFYKAMEAAQQSSNLAPPRSNWSTAR